MSTELAIRPEQSTFDEKQIAALRSLGVEDAPAGDVALLFHQSVRTGLDPFLKQIYLIGRNSKVKKWENGKQVERWETKYTIQTGIDGYRVIRDRRGTYQGHTEEWCGTDGIWRDVWLSTTPPAAARVSVHVKGYAVPVVGIALWTEYAQYGKGYNSEPPKPTAQWASKPALMLAKCAEALALRKAYPQDLSGIYTSDEMQQAENGPDGVPLITQVAAPTHTVEEEARVADEWAGKARASATRTDALDLYRDAKHRGFLAYATTEGEFLGDVLLERGKNLAAEEAQAVAGEPEQAPVPEAEYNEAELV